MIEYANKVEKATTAWKETIEGVREWERKPYADIRSYFISCDRLFTRVESQVMGRRR